MECKCVDTDLEGAMGVSLVTAMSNDHKKVFTSASYFKLRAMKGT